MANNVAMWLENESEYSLKNKDVILLDCYIKLKDYEIAKIKGIKCLKNSFDIYNYSEAAAIAVSSRMSSHCLKRNFKLE